MGNVETNAERLAKIKEILADIDKAYEANARGSTTELLYVLWEGHSEFVLYHLERAQELEEQKEWFRRNIVDMKAVEVFLRKENKRLREAITLSLEKHKWNNEESARILEEALEVSE